ncbi:MAG TPA: 50S ribosomal protein L3 [Acidimicrobiia bacterium]|uniref:Large ribosomal subunit protein uL3 n=1 Tax=uncultured actinobacterium Rifle_16ft_4_minimus_2010 TaxID=1665146 RepID=A0A0H4T1Y4_9ACTN|nr:50S ribosomal protein L3, large subunit ribosomal protein L3 [uncultured actinobacterium Rifle_16ft_4_minimus_2010]HLE38525.1 50S ribosomal protein L3 [Acidimicrobiia bacterium]
MKAILGEKLGMTQIFDAESRAVPVTVIKAGPCRVVQIKRLETDGYAAVQLAYRELSEGRVTKPQAGHFQRVGLTPHKHLVEVRVDDPDAYKVGQEIGVADVLVKGGLADVAGVSRGKGFQGVMKRHNFAGQGASHGAHLVHRAPGSIGACATPSRVFKGMRMPGRMGGEKTTVLNLEVVEVDAVRGLLMLRGAVPGAKGAVVLVREAVKGLG